MFVLANLLQNQYLLAMIRNVLIPVDFSDVSMNAIEYVKHLTRKMSCTILLFHSKRMIVTPDQAIQTMHNGMFDDADELNLNQHMDKLVNDLANEGVTVNKVIRIGSLAEDISNVVIENNIDLIVSGTSGAGNIEGLFFGTNSVGIFKQVKCPVLIIPSNCNFRLIKKVLYATDFQEGHSKELKKICSFAELFDAEVAVVHVNTYASTFNDDKEKLEQFAEVHAADINYNKISYSVIHNDTVFDGLESEITSKYIDVICMAKGQKSFFEELLFKSNTKEMAFQTRIPLMVVHLD